MAWSSKKRRGTWPRKQPAIAAAVERKLSRKAPKRYQWVPLVDNLCAPQMLDCKGCCTDPEFPENVIRGCTYDELGVVELSQPNSFPLVLISPADVPDSGEQGLWDVRDNLTVVKLEGWVELCPAFCSGADETAACDSDPQTCPVARLFATNFDNYHFRAGLSKDRWELDPLVDPPGYSTIQRWPLETHDWSDAQFIRTWERTKSRKRIIDAVELNGNAPLGCCSNVSAAGAGAPANTLSNGSGTVNIPAISTDCEPCGTDAVDTFRVRTNTTEQYGCFRLSLNSRRRLTFKENEGLTLWLDWTSYTPGISPGIGWRRNVGFQVRTVVKALVESA